VFPSHDPTEEGEIERRRQEELDRRRVPSESVPSELEDAGVTETQFHSKINEELKSAEDFAKALKEKGKSNEEIAKRVRSRLFKQGNYTQVTSIFFKDSIDELLDNGNFNLTELGKGFEEIIAKYDAELEVVEEEVVEEAPKAEEVVEEEVVEEVIGEDLTLEQKQEYKDKVQKRIDRHKKKLNESKSEKEKFQALNDYDANNNTLERKTGERIVDEEFEAERQRLKDLESITQRILKLLWSLSLEEVRFISTWSMMVQLL